jgi:CCR4-NOT transcription complex subunit 4
MPWTLHPPPVLTCCQICQFCYNNIKTTMNGLCPACRRPYDDSTIEFKNITPEEWVFHARSP